uniref:Globin domain-containing protein n=1 Tax=Ascaris suum TaxID=6253 RepID=F1LCQ5_ASCSU
MSRKVRRFLSFRLLPPESRQITADRSPSMKARADRRRSKSLCGQQMKNECQSVANSLHASQNITTSGRRSSNALVPPLTRLRIQQCFKAARPPIGQQILKRACILRSEMRLFLAHLPDDMVDELAIDLYTFISNCVENIDDPDRVNALARAFGEQHAALCSLGFRPDYFAPIADAAIAECVRLDGGAHKRCETLLAWSQLIAAMFTGVRDGYYARVRMQRRTSLPQQQRLMLNQQISFERKN